MQIDRLFGIVYILLERKNMTAEKLATHFEVSKRTILRDLDTLTLAGIPIYTTRGKGGGISILDHFILNKTTISDEEQNQILMALQSVAPTLHKDADQLYSKLVALFNKTNTTWIEVDFSRWGNIQSDTEKFEQLKEAIIKKSPLSFDYASTHGEITHKTVYPLKLIFKSKSWYLQAFCQMKNDYRTYKINRMQHIEVLVGSFAGQEFSPPAIDPKEASTIPIISLKLVFSADVAYRVYDEFDVKDIQHNEDGTFTVRTDFPNDSWLIGFLLSFGTSVQILEPQSLKTKLLAQIQSIEKFYTENIK